jgi:hypothetical protein
MEFPDSLKERKEQFMKGRMKIKNISYRQQPQHVEEKRRLHITVTKGQTA